MTDIAGDTDGSEASAAAATPGVDSSIHDDGLPGAPVAGYPGLRAGAFGLGEGALGILRTGPAVHAGGFIARGLTDRGGRLTNATDNFEVAGPVTTPAYPHAWDSIVNHDVADFNKMNGADPGDEIYLDPDLVKAMIMTESGHDRRAYNSDPMQVNNPHDWDGYKGEIGLIRGQAPGPDLGIRAGLAWLDSKAYYEDNKGRPGPFLGWETTVKRYNGHGNPNYWQDVQANLKTLKGQ